MNKNATAWELWALALLGLWLKFFRGKTASPASPPATRAAAPGQWWQAFGGGMLSVVHAIGMLLALGAVIGLVAMGLRLFMRRRRFEAMVAEEIILGPDDNAHPDEMVATLDAIHTTLLTRYGGSAIGQVSWAFEIIRDQDGQIHFVIAAPHGWLTGIEDIWRNVYTNLRFKPWGDRARTWPVAQQIVLQRPWPYPTRIDTDYTTSVVEMMVQAMDRASGELRLQWLMTPLPVGPLTAKLRGSLHQVERDAQSAKANDPAHPGLGVVDRQDVSEATALLGRSAFRAEVRMAADDWHVMQRVYGALAGANGANQWKAQTVWAFKGVWTRWLDRRVPSVGLFGHAILFSKPLATVIHIPSARLRVQSLNRMLVRRGPAPSTIPRTPALAILKDEIGPVGIPEGDRKFNTLFIGSQGGGKSTGMLQQLRVDATWHDRRGRPKALVLIDIGKDTAKRALGIVPPNRDVIWFDPADPDCPWTLNPLMAGVHADALANDVLESLTQVFGDDAIRSRSREFLGNAILAVKEVHGSAADFTMVYKMLTDNTFRQHVIDNVQDPHQRDYWQGTFTNTLANNQRFVEEGLAAPRNKLDEVLRSAAIRAVLTGGAGRQQINLRDVIEGRKVLIANLDKARLGKSGARLLGVFLITMVWHALETQTDIPEDQRVPTALVIDEAQNFISEGFLDILAEGRAYGAQTTLAVRFLGEILSDRAILGVRTLVQNLVIYQFELREEAEDFMKRFMRTYSNMISPNDEAQDNINFGADDFMRLPKHHVVCRWMVDGSPQQAFLAETIPWESVYDEATKQHHLARQPRRALPVTTDDAWDDDPSMPPEAEDVLEDTMLDGAAAWGGEETSQMPEPWAEEDVGATPAPDPAPAAGPPLWLRWLVGSADPATWWDAETGAGLAPLWQRVQQEAGVPWVWELEGLDTMNPAWVPAVRQRAVQVARAVGGADGVYAWITPAILGCWLAEENVPREEAWQQAAQARNVHWHRRQETVPGPDATVLDSQTPDHAESVPLPPEPTPPAPSKARKMAGVPVEPPLEPLLWKRLERQSGLTTAQVLAWQTQYKATDAEIAGTVRWAVEHHLAPKTAEHTFVKVLRQKMQDRWIHPICDQVGASRKAVADVLLASTRPLSYWGRWMKQHPEVTSVDALREAVQADNPPSQAVP